MRLDSITKIERFMTNALLSSPLVPLGVNVIRLADVSDEEGILQMANSMVVRYTGSNVQVVKRSPLTLEYSMNFEVNIASQSYLTQSGHDLAVQLCTASRLTLLNSVPPNSGVEVVQSFVLTNERFAGLTDSSHYTYTQQWEIVVQDLHRAIAIDPCVQRGDCTKLFPSNLKSRLRPGETVCGTIIYAPVLPPPNDAIPYDSQYAGAELNSDGDLVYTWEPNRIFMSATEIAEGYYTVCTGNRDESGQFEVINIHRPDGEFDRFFFGADTGNRLMRISGDLVRVSYDIPGIAENEGNVELWYSADLQRNGYGQVSTYTPTFIYADPTNSTSTKVLVSPGAVFPTAEGVTLTVEDDTFIRVGGTPLGRAWIKAKDFTLLSPDDYLPRLDCEEDELEEGKITSCE